MAAVVAWPAAEALRILVERPSVTLYGDQALIDLAARRAWHLDQWVGPYSRNGFHHPGPAMFYLLAPFVRLLEPGGAGLYLGAVVLNGVALAATVAVLWWWLGARAAVWGAVCLDLFVLCLGVGTLREPWNPYLVIVPMVLFVVLWAVSVTEGRRSSAGLWAAVVGSFEVQTHVATLPFVVALGAVLIVRRYRTGWRDVGPWTCPRVAALAALILIWVPPVVELWRQDPNNLSQIGTYFGATHPTAGFAGAVRAGLASLGVVPFGNHDYVVALRRPGLELAASAVLVVAGTAVAWTLGRRARKPVASALAAGAGLEAGIGVLSLWAAPAPLYPYFTVWLAGAPLLLLLAFGLAHPPTLGRVPFGSADAAPRPVLAVGLVLAILVVGSDLRTPPVQDTAGSGPWPQAEAAVPGGHRNTVINTAILDRAAVAALPPRTGWAGIRIDSPGLWPYAAGLVLALAQTGVQSTVSPASWTLYFGEERRPGHPVAVSFVLDQSGAAPAAGHVLQRIDGAILSIETTGAASK